MQKLILAIQFLTVIPLKGSSDLSFKGVLKYFPLAGALIGFVVLGGYNLALLIFPREIAVLLMLISLVALTGALHLDGFCDSLDGIFGGKTKEERLKIMKDERIGSFAAVGLVLLILLKITVLMKLSSAIVLQSVFLAIVLARFSAVVSIAVSPPAKNEGLGFHIKESLVHSDIVMAALVSVLLALFVTGLTGLLAVLLVSIFSVLFSKYVTKRAGGITGDTLGALIEITEVLILLFFAIKR